MATPQVMRADDMQDISRPLLLNMDYLQRDGYSGSRRVQSKHLADERPNVEVWDSDNLVPECQAAKVHLEAPSMRCAHTGSRAFSETVVAVTVMRHSIIAAEQVPCTYGRLSVVGFCSLTNYGAQATQVKWSAMKSTATYMEAKCPTAMYGSSIVKAFVLLQMARTGNDSRSDKEPWR